MANFISMNHHRMSNQLDDLAMNLKNHLSCVNMKFLSRTTLSSAMWSPSKPTLWLGQRFSLGLKLWQTSMKDTSIKSNLKKILTTRCVSNKQNQAQTAKSRKDHQITWNQLHANSSINQVNRATTDISKCQKRGTHDKLYTHTEFVTFTVFN